MVGQNLLGAVGARGVPAVSPRGSPGVGELPPSLAVGLCRFCALPPAAAPRLSLLSASAVCRAAGMMPLIVGLRELIWPLVPIQVLPKALPAPPQRLPGSPGRCWLLFSRQAHHRSPSQLESRSWERGGSPFVRRGRGMSGSPGGEEAPSGRASPWRWLSASPSTRAWSRCPSLCRCLRLAAVELAAACPSLRCLGAGSG